MSIYCSLPLVTDLFIADPAILLKESPTGIFLNILLDNTLFIPLDTIGTAPLVKNVFVKSPPVSLDIDALIKALPTADCTAVEFFLLAPTPAPTPVAKLKQ